MTTSSSTGGYKTEKSWKDWLPKDHSILMVLLGTALTFEILGWFISGQSFIFNTQRLTIIILQMSIIGIIAIGVTQIIIMAGIDLSSGSMLAFTGLVAASLAQTSDFTRAVYPALTDMPVLVPILAGILMGFVLGGVNGGLIAYSGIPPFIATLGMLVAARGLARWYTSGSQVSFFIDDYAILGSGIIPVIIFLTTAMAFHLLLRYTRYGRYTYAIGSNEQAARVAGINIRAHKLLVYTLAGGLYGLAAVVETSRTLTAQSGAGMLYELDAIAAVVIGGTSLMGGKGRITGTIIGVCILGVITSGFTFLGIGSFYTNIVKGIIIVAAVVADQYRNNNNGNR